MGAAPPKRVRADYGSWLVGILALVAVGCSKAVPLSASGCEPGAAAESCRLLDGGVAPDASTAPQAGASAPAVSCMASPECGDEALCMDGTCRALTPCTSDDACSAEHGLCIQGRCRIACTAAPDGCGAEHAGWVCAALERDVCLPQGTFPGAACSGSQSCGAYVHGSARFDLTCHAGTCRVPCTLGAQDACAEAAALRCTSISTQSALCLPAQASIGSTCNDDAACASSDSTWPLRCVQGHCAVACSDAGHWPGYANALCQTLGADFVCDAGTCRARPPQILGRIAAENALPGDASWALRDPASAREIEGYSDKTSVNLGDNIALYVHTAESSYTLELFRLGYYAGRGARRVLGPVQRSGVAQAMPEPDADGLVACDWRDPYNLSVPREWVSGVYLAKLTAQSSHKQSFIVFVVRDDARTSDYLFQSSVTTYQAYNNWGGKSLYDDNSSAGRRATRVSFNRPYALGSDASGLGAGELLAPLFAGTAQPTAAWEYPLLRFLEREGYDVTYATNIDTHDNPRLLEGHRAFLSVGRDAYWTWNMRGHVEQARDRFGTHLGFFSAHACSWQARLEPDAQGKPLRTLLAYKDQSDPIAETANSYQLTTEWSEPALDLSQVTMLGVQQQSTGVDADLIVDDDTSWVLAGTGLRRGDRLPGLLGHAVDAVPGVLPAGHARVMHSPFSAQDVAQGYADMITFAAPSGAWTFSAGTLQLAWGVDDYAQRALPASRLSPAAQQLARNVLARLRSAPKPALEQTLFAEHFDASSPDEERMRAGVISEGAAALDPSVSVRLQAGSLVITPREQLSGLHHNGLVSARTWDLTGGAAQVTLAATPDPGSAADSTFALSTDEDHWVRFTQEGQWLLLQIRSDSGLDTAAVSYDATAQRVLRLRHELTTGMWVWETSPDGVHFSEKRRTGASFSTSAMRWELEAGTYMSVTAPGSARFDDLLLTSSGFIDDFTGARKAERWSPGVLSEGAERYDLHSIPVQYAGSLSVRTPAAASSGSGYVSARSWDLTGGEATVELTQVAPVDASTVFALAKDAQHWVRFELSEGMLRCQDQLEGGRSQTESSYDAHAHRHLRMLHHPGTDTLTWEVSPDGADWTVLRTRNISQPLTGMRAELAIYATQPNAQGASVFQRFSLHSGLFDP